LDFDDIKVSLKASNVGLAAAAYRAFSRVSDYPLHLGITEAGTAFSGGIKSAVGLGILLAEGIGDTIRVSLAADPVEEVKTGYEILKALELRRRGVNVVACPTCGRLEIDVIRMANEVERRLAHVKEPLTVSILGCVVNGIGEGKEADIGIAGGGKGVGLLFRHGEVVRKVPMDTLTQTLLEEVDLILKERAAQSSTAPASAGQL
jgi:(E)-4-hydroxy-3-methylbut-2-enyl-diphosphate synthase